MLRFNGVIVLIVLGLSGGSALYGQAGSSTITGRVTDVTGATVPKVSVSIVQTETNFRSPAETNQDGIYRLPALSPGTYSITFESPGFKKFVRGDVELRAGDVLAID